MGNANGTVYNDTNGEVRIYTFNYADGLRYVPDQTHDISPGTSQHVEASPHGSGLIVATGVKDEGRHYALGNGQTVNVSSILSHGDNNPSYVASTVFMVAGCCAAIAATGGAAGVALAPAGAASISATTAAGMAGAGTFATTVVATGASTGAQHASTIPPSQHFYIINPDSTKALDVSGCGTANGTNIQLWDFNGSGAQLWKLVGNSIVNTNSGKALDVDSSGTTNGTNIQLWERNGTGAQEWLAMTDGTIVNPPSGKVLDVCDSGRDNGTNIQLWERNGSGAQRWVFVLPK